MRARLQLSRSAQRPRACALLWRPKFWPSFGTPQFRAFKVISSNVHQSPHLLSKRHGTSRSKYNSCILTTWRSFSSATSTDRMVRLFPVNREADVLAILKATAKNHALHDDVTFYRIFLLSSISGKSYMGENFLIMLDRMKEEKMEVWEKEISKGKMEQFSAEKTLKIVVDLNKALEPADNLLNALYHSMFKAVFRSVNNRWPDMEDLTKFFEISSPMQPTTMDHVIFLNKLVKSLLPESIKNKKENFYLFFDEIGALEERSLPRYRDTHLPNGEPLPVSERFGAFFRAVDRFLSNPSVACFVAGKSLHLVDAQATMKKTSPIQLCFIRMGPLQPQHISEIIQKSTISGESMETVLQKNNKLPKHLIEELASQIFSWTSGVPRQVERILEYLIASSKEIKTKREIQDLFAGIIYNRVIADRTAVALPELNKPELGEAFAEVLKMYNDHTPFHEFAERKNLPMLDLVGQLGFYVGPFKQKPQDQPQEGEGLLELILPKFTKLAWMKRHNVAKLLDDVAPKWFGLEQKIGQTLTYNPTYLSDLLMTSSYFQKPPNDLHQLRYEPEGQSGLSSLRLMTTSPLPYTITRPSNSQGPDLYTLIDDVFIGFSCKYLQTKLYSYLQLEKEVQYLQEAAAALPDSGIKVRGMVVFVMATHYAQAFHHTLAHSSPEGFWKLSAGETFPVSRSGGLEANVPIPPNCEIIIIHPDIFSNYLPSNYQQIIQTFTTKYKPIPG